MERRKISFVICYIPFKTRIKKHMKRMHQPKALKGSCRICDESLSDKPRSTRGDPKAERTGSERGLVVGIDCIVGLPESKEGHNAVLIMAVSGKARMIAARETPS